MASYDYSQVFTNGRFRNWLVIKRVTQWIFNPSSRRSYCLTFTGIYFHRVNQNGFKLNGTHQLLGYNDVNMLGESLHTVKKHSSC